MFGSIVLASNGSPEILPIFKDYLSGTHNPGRKNGAWFISPGLNDSREYYLPQRDKNITVFCKDPEHPFWEYSLQKHESVKATQHERLFKMTTEWDSPNSNCAVFNTQGEHGSISLAIKNAGGIKDTFQVVVVRSSKSTQLLWSECNGEELIWMLRRSDPREYSFYRFPVVETVLFINTLAVCAKWWNWTNSLGYDTLRASSALEVMLMKDA